MILEVIFVVWFYTVLIEIKYELFWNEGIPLITYLYDYFMDSFWIQYTLLKVS